MKKKVFGTLILSLILSGSIYFATTYNADTIIITCNQNGEFSEEDEDAEEERAERHDEWEESFETWEDIEEVQEEVD